MQYMWFHLRYGRCLGKASKILQVAAYSRRYHHRMGMAH